MEMLDWTADQLTWTNLKPRFQRQFATQMDEKMIIEGLSNLAMKPSESTGELLARITNTMVILKESYASHENKPAAPAHHHVNGGFTISLARHWRDEALNNAQQFLKMQLFRAALPAELRKVVAQKNPIRSRWTTCIRLLQTLKGRPDPRSNKRSQPFAQKAGITMKEMKI